MDLQEYIVAGLPNVNVISARIRLKRLNTVESIFYAAIKELIKVEGIGKKKSKYIKVLSCEYETDD